MKKKLLIILILLAVAVVLLVGYLAVVRPLVNKTTKKTVEPVPLLEGEAYYRVNGKESNQIPVVFPPYERETLYEIKISNGSDYGFTHYISGGRDFFLMWSTDGNGDPVYYYPDIAMMTEGFDYTTLYDETSKIPLMIAASGSIAFKDRVFIRADAETPLTDDEFQTVLRRYGLADGDHPVYYEITGLMCDDMGRRMYYDEDLNLYCYDGNATNPRFYDAFALRDSGYDYDATPTANVTLKDLTAVPGNDTVKIYVGDLLPDETGYYLRMEGRDIVYSTGTTTIGKVVFQSLSYYIHPRLVQAADNQASSLYTPSFRVFHGTGEKTTGIAAGDTVLFSAETMMKSTPFSETSGAISLTDTDTFADLIDALVASGASVGDTIPLLVGSKVDLFYGVGPGSRSTFEIYSVSAVIRAGELLSEAGTVVQAGDRAICVYAADGVRARGMIDLSDPDLPASLSDAIVGLTIGAESGEPLATVTVNFTGSETTPTDFQVESIMAYALSKTSLAVSWDSSKKTTRQLVTLPKTAPYGYVAVTYSYKVDGVLRVSGTTLCIDGGNATLAENEMAKAIREAIQRENADKGANDKKTLTLGYREGIVATVALPNDPFTSYEIYRNFKVTGIAGTVEELGVAYANETERNIFYGGSAYEIKSPASRTLYSVNDDNLMDVLQNVFNEAVGSETVAVGLTAENFAKYGLFAHAVYFEMPCSLTYRNGTAMDVGVGYEVGFHLYVSDRKTSAAGDFYYVASDLYGIVAKVMTTDLNFSFVDWTFGVEWVDTNLLLLSLTNIRDITFRINYSDLRETHGFALSVNPYYHMSMDDDDVTSRVYVAYVPGAVPVYSETVIPSERAETDRRYYTDRVGYYRTTYGTQLTQIDENFYLVRTVTNEGAIGLDQHYENQRGEEIELSGVNYEGVGNFTKLITLIYTSDYSGPVKLTDLSDAEAARIADLLETDASGNYVLSDEDAADLAVLTIRLSLVDGRVFTLTFYPYSDGRYLLSFVDSTAGLTSREFYMNMGEIKNIVTAVRTIVAGGEVFYDVSYLPEPN